MRLRTATTTRLLVVLLTVLVAVAASCGTTSTVASGTSGTDEAAATMGCAEGAAPLAALLATGLPSYDYEPSMTLDELVATTDVVVTGTLASAIRVAGETNNEELEPIDTAFTQMEAAEWEVLSAAAEGDVEDDADIFLMDSWWAGPGDDDPLGAEVTFETEVRYLAFLHRHEAWPALAVDVQGLVIGCGDDPVVPVTDPLPADTAGRSIDELIALLSDEGSTSSPTTGRGESVSIAHRILADGVADESREPWSTARLQPEEIGSIDPSIELDEESEVFFGFWLAESGSCPYGPMNDLRYDLEFQVIYPDVPLAGGKGQDCEDDANAHLIMVAVPRSELPEGNLALWVDGEEPKPSMTDNMAFFADGELTRAESALPYTMLEEGDSLGVGETAVAIGVDTHCGLERLYYLVDGRQWLIASGGAVPPPWEGTIRGESIDLLITRTTADELEISAFGTDEGATYIPADDIEGCM